ncbi:protein of unknown function [Limimonas halophila]|uniref:DUF4174 domain-containing protein n=1 Tax=Limimonas halophila TaxID=1082479 RepID=A0A1G7TQT1_9PROT|nr:DUF4174 domain-containing protein [Limimonas halophila]SDG37655.1 protein of unknown function [Limimonas halophila]
MRAMGLAVAAMMLAALPAQAGMERFTWANRPLVVLAPDADHPALGEQRAIAEAHAAGFRERDMVVVTLAGDGPVRVDGEPARDVDPAALRARFGVAHDAFRALLVGKDGTVKLSRGESIAADTLFRTIDAMPMRQREMREQGDG